MLLAHERPHSDFSDSCVTEEEHEYSSDTDSVSVVSYTLTPEMFGLETASFSTGAVENEECLAPENEDETEDDRESETETEEELVDVEDEVVEEMMEMEVREEEIEIAEGEVDIMVGEVEVKETVKVERGRMEESEVCVKEEKEVKNKLEVEDVEGGEAMKQDVMVVEAVVEELQVCEATMKFQAAVTTDVWPSLNAKNSSILSSNECYNVPSNGN